MQIANIKKESFPYIVCAEGGKCKKPVKYYCCVEEEDGKLHSGRFRCKKHAKKFATQYNLDFDKVMGIYSTKEIQREDAIDFVLKYVYKISNESLADVMDDIIAADVSDEYSFLSNFIVIGDDSPESIKSLADQRREFLSLYPEESLYEGLPEVDSKDG